MTIPNYKESHPEHQHKPNLPSHQQKEISSHTVSQIEKRTAEFSKEFFKNKKRYNLVTDSLGRIVFDVPKEEIEIRSQ